jgi:hypothetical protein
VRSVNLSLGSPAVSAQIDRTGGQVRRMSTRETTGAVQAIFQIWDGTNTGGQLIDTIVLSAGQSTRDYYRIHEYPYHNGLYLAVISGTFEGAVVVCHSDDWDHEGEPVVMINPNVLAVSV